MLWKKPSGMKFTDMCIFIDENVPKIVNPGEYPELENTIYNYLWLLVKALAIKKCMFKDFQDYDMYAFYSANRLYLALRKNQLNQGKTIKGKLIRPIKSCLNYTKALLYPMKIEYQRIDAEQDGAALADVRGMYGWHLVDKNTGVKVFMPAVGRRSYENGVLTNMNNYGYEHNPMPWIGYYWTASATNDNKAQSMFFDLNTTRAVNNRYEAQKAMYRGNGMQIRCVRE